MNRILSAMVVVFLCAITAQSQTPTSDTLQMTDNHFKAFLIEVESVLPGWETQLMSIDLEKAPQISYAKGKSIMNQRDRGLRYIAGIRVVLSKLRVKRTVTDELTLHEILQGLFDDGNEIVWEEDSIGLTLTHLEQDLPELSELAGRIGNDVNARVELLEKGVCP